VSIKQAFIMQVANSIMSDKRLQMKGDNEQVIIQND